MTVKEFKIEDWYAIKDPVEPGEFDIKDPTVFDRGFSVTAFEFGKVLMCGGIVIRDDNLGELWLRVSQSTSPMTVAKAVLTVYQILKDRFSDFNIMCRATKGFKKGHRLIRRLGFKEHSQIKDCVVYV